MNSLYYISKLLISEILDRKIIISYAKIIDCINKANNIIKNKYSNIILFDNYNITNDFINNLKYKSYYINLKKIKYKYDLIYTNDFILINIYRFGNLIHIHIDLKNKYANLFIFLNSENNTYYNIINQYKDYLKLAIKLLDIYFNITKIYLINDAYIYNNLEIIPFNLIANFFNLDLYNLLDFKIITNTSLTNINKININDLNLTNINDIDFKIKDYNELLLDHLNFLLKEDFVLLIKFLYELIRCNNILNINTVYLYNK